MEHTGMENIKDDGGAMPFKIEYNPNYDLFVARIDMSVCELGDEAEIILAKK